MENKNKKHKKKGKVETVDVLYFLFYFYFIFIFAGRRDLGYFHITKWGDKTPRKKKKEKELLGCSHIEKVA